MATDFRGIRRGARSSIWLSGRETARSGCPSACTPCSRTSITAYSSTLSCIRRRSVCAVIIEMAKVSVLATIDAPCARCVPAQLFSLPLHVASCTVQGKQGRTKCQPDGGLTLLRKFFLLIAIAALALVVVMAAKTIMNTPGNVTVTAIDPPAIDAAAAAERLAAAVRIRTISTGRNDPPASAEFERLHQ